MRSTICSSARLLLPAFLLFAAVLPASRAAQGESFLGKAYPLRAEVKFHIAMMHWLDSLADLRGFGFTGGQTTPAHRQEYERLFGPLTGEAADRLRAYRKCRIEFVRSQSGWLPDRLTRVFLESDDFASARVQAGGLLELDDRKAFIQAMDFFEPMYRQIWNDGERARGFLNESLDADRKRVGRLLRRVAEFLGADPAASPVSRLYPVPVPDGYGTHAQTLHQHLIVEIRPGDTLADQIAPVVHESAHFLFYRADRSALEAAQRQVEERGPYAVEAWQLLREALPTAIAQGYAEQQLNPDAWSMSRRWYHREDVDRYAKLLFPTVRQALRDKQRRFDEAFVVEVLDIYREATRRSP